jgi:LEA14-like dessication related protein
MTPKKKIIIIAIVVFVILAIVISIWAARQKSLLEKTCFKPNGIAVKRFGLKDADVTLNLLMNNMSSIDYTITKQDYKILISGKEVSHIKSGKDQYIAAGTKSPVALDVKFNLSQIAKQTIAELVTSGDVKIVMKGYAKIRKGIFPYKYPVDATFTMKEMTSGEPSDPC